MKPADSIILQHDGWYLQVSLSGGCILSCSYRGQDILRPAPDDWTSHPDPVLASNFPLVPFSNRIARGEFSFGGRDIKLPITRPEEPHPIHGYGWASEWDVSYSARNELELLFVYSGTDWPWEFTCKQKFVTQDNVLTLSLHLENTSPTPMPAGLGFHPYFPEPDTALLTFSKDGFWKSDPENIPTEWQVFNDDAALQIINQDFDNCFTGWDQHATICWPSRTYKLGIQGSRDLEFAVLYTPKNEDYFCFEPVSHMNDAVNFENRAVHTGLKVLNPGESLNVSMNLHTTPI